MPEVKGHCILVGVETANSAAFLWIRTNCALVQTVEFCSTVVGGSFAFGEISAVNLLSIIYAIGAIPLFALNVVGFPANQLSNDGIPVFTYNRFNHFWMVGMNPVIRFILFNQAFTDLAALGDNVAMKLFPC